MPEKSLAVDPAKPAPIRNPTAKMLPARGRRLKMLPAKRPEAENAPCLAEEKDEESDEKVGAAIASDWLEEERPKKDENAGTEKSSRSC